MKRVMTLMRRAATKIAATTVTKVRLLTGGSVACGA